MSKNIAIIFAGGSGARMGAGLPKQFLEVNGKAIIIHTLDIFEEHHEIDEIYVACKEEYIPKLNKLIRKNYISKVVKVVPGGANGQESIYHALEAAKENNTDDAIVLIHDGVRPCITRELISENIASVQEFGSAVTCKALYETPIISKDAKNIDEVPPRNIFYTAQAPQCFYLGEVMEAHRMMRECNPEYKDVVDTCTLMKMTGKDVKLVEGPRGNIKVTTPEDLYIFRAMIQYRETEEIFGFGHREVRQQLKK